MNPSATTRRDTVPMWREHWSESQEAWAPAQFCCVVTGPCLGLTHRLAPKVTGAQGPSMVSTSTSRQLTECRQVCRGLGDQAAGRVRGCRSFQPFSPASLTFPESSRGDSVLGILIHTLPPLYLYRCSGSQLSIQPPPVSFHLCRTYRCKIKKVGGKRKSCKDKFLLTYMFKICPRIKIDLSLPST